MAQLDKLIEKKLELEKQIGEKQNEEYLKFGKWFFNQYKINSSIEAKKIVKNYKDDIEKNNNNLEEKEGLNS